MKTANQIIAKKYGFQIGDQVIVNCELKRKFKGSNVKWEKHLIPDRAGWFVGIRTLQEGEVVIPGGTDMAAYFKVTNTIKRVAMVIFWPTMKPILVPLANLIGGHETVQPYYWSDRDRKEMSKTMKGTEFKRDAKGRFIKE